jgi:DNA-binding Xre family transcriptional regulator
MAIETKRGVPGVPLAALDAVQDQNARMVLRAIVDGWNVRNGSSGRGDMAFVTKSEVDTLAGAVGGLQQSFNRFAGSPPASGLTPGEISRIINDLQAQIIESQLFKELGERIDLIDAAIVDEQNARIAAVQEVADDLAAEAATRLGFDTVQGSQIATLQTTTTTQATQISGLTTRVSGAESTIINLQSTTAQQATALTNLTSRVGVSESSISELRQTTFNQAQSLTSLTTRMGSAESNISTLNTTTAQQATSLTSLTTRVSNTESAITSEATTRANADNAITTTLNTQIAAVNGNLAGLQTQQTTTANNVAALTRSLTTLQTTVGDNTIALQTEATVRANADNDIYGKYSVKIDNNGYVTGFGLISTSNNSTPFSEFLVRADRFAIASPAGPGVAPKVPFIVTTQPTLRPDGVVVQPGVYIDNAVIKDLYGAYIEAGYFRAGKIYTGSQYIDAISNEPIAVVANGSYETAAYYPTNNPGYSTERTEYGVIGTVDGDNIFGSYTTYTYNNSALVGPISMNLIFYGPEGHTFCPYAQRIRDSSQYPVEFVCSVACVADHYLSLWYRIMNINTGVWGPWTFLTKVTEPQSSYGSAALVVTLTKSLAPNQAIQFTVAPVDIGYSFSDRNKLNLYDVNVNVRVTNL